MTVLRAILEQRERETLAAFATFASDSQGRREAEPEHSYRTAFQRDRDRILHSKAFRRLKYKTQVFLTGEDDHYRTRLTHTLETAQIARTVARALRLNEDLVEAIALGHDLGHTPFGHAGEQVLDELYAPGFRHYEQSLRVVDVLEDRHTGPGLNLTFEVRDGILNHSKGKSIFSRKSEQRAATLEGDVVSVCDAIAYVNHDIDDAIRAGVITLEDLPQEAVSILGRSTSERIDAMVIGLIEGTHDGDINIVPEILEATNELRNYMYANVYPCETIQREIRKAKSLLSQLYTFLIDNPDDNALIGASREDRERWTVDFVAGMTDHYAVQLYTTNFFPTAWRV